MRNTKLMFGTEGKDQLRHTIKIGDKVMYKQNLHVVCGVEFDCKCNSKCVSLVKCNNYWNHRIRITRELSDNEINDLTLVE